jgi:uncharacterized protein YigA (DUF484 family)
MGFWGLGSNTLMVFEYLGKVRIAQRAVYGRARRRSVQSSAACRLRPTARSGKPKKVALTALMRKLLIR